MLPCSHLQHVAEVYKHDGLGLLAADDVQAARSNLAAAATTASQADTAESLEICSGAADELPSFTKGTAALAAMLPEEDRVRPAAAVPPHINRCQAWHELMRADSWWLWPMQLCSYTPCHTRPHLHITLLGLGEGEYTITSNKCMQTPPHPHPPKKNIVPSLLFHFPCCCWQLTLPPPPCSPCSLMLLAAPPTPTPALPIMFPDALLLLPAPPAPPRSPPPLPPPG